MQYKLFLILFISFTLCHNSSAQKEDFIWLLGDDPADAYDSIRLKDTMWGSTNIDFNYDPVKIYYEPIRILDFLETNASICDSNGTLVCYSNGMVVYNGNHQPVEDTISYGDLWENFNLDHNGIPIPSGFRAVQGVLILPAPNQSNIYYIFYEKSNPKKLLIESKMMGLIDMNLNEGRGGMIFRDSVIVTDTVSSGGTTAVRHANGRDWWVLLVDRYVNELHLFLLGPEGLSLIKTQYIGLPWLYDQGVAIFSPDGSKLAIACGYNYGNKAKKLTLYDFDRCTGDLILKYEEYERMNPLNGLCFSPNGKYLYLSDGLLIYQYDTDADNISHSKRLVAEYDGFEYAYSEFYKAGVFLALMANAPDGRVYVFSVGSNRFFSKIEYPDEYFKECDVRQHSNFVSASFQGTLPNFPNYRLGPLDGSSCDTLGLDNHPIAKYRYESDTLDHLKVHFTDLSYFRPETWHWDFGDGTTFDGKKPYWHTFPKNGAYNVCLTVSNENSENTTCRLVTIGTNSINIDPIKVSKEIVSVFPNPTDGEILLTLSDYIPEHGVVEVYDMLGKLHHKSRVYYGWNNLDLKNVHSGTYHYVIKDGNHVISSGSIVKI